MSRGLLIAEMHVENDAEYSKNGMKRENWLYLFIYIYITTENVFLWRWMKMS